MVIASVIQLLFIVHILVGGMWNHIMLLVIGWALMLKQCYYRPVNMEALSDAVDHQFAMVKTALMAIGGSIFVWYDLFRRLCSGSTTPWCMLYRYSCYEW